MLAKSQLDEPSPSDRTRPVVIGLGQADPAGHRPQAHRVPAPGAPVKTGKES
jgi:hypothetical protein